MHGFLGLQNWPRRLRLEVNPICSKRSKQVNWVTPNPALLRYGDENIDPFSFFYFLAGKNTIQQFEHVYGSVTGLFDLPNDMLEYGPFTFPTPKFKFLFHDAETFKPSLLWRFFRQVVDDGQKINQQDFRDVLEIKNVGVRKLTQSLFIIKPTRFLPIDKNSDALAEFQPEIRFSKIEKKILKRGYSEFEKAINKIKKNFPECAYYEINYFLYQQKRKSLINDKSNFFQISTNANADNVDLWEQNESNTEIDARTFKENSIVYVTDLTDKYPLKHPDKGDIVFVRYGLTNGRGIGVILKNEYKNRLDENAAIHVVWINKSRSDFTEKTTRYGFSKISSDSKTYKNFKDAKDYFPTFRLIDSWVHPPSIYKGYSLNTILYGPPGTGKTYSTRHFCVEICESRARGATENDSAEDLEAKFQELVDDGRIEFITFHQTYGYEEFVEGLRPQPISENGGDGGFRLIVQDGVLKRFADTARESSALRFVLVIDEINRANISKVLGELITILEEDKREGAEHELAVKLPFSGDKFALPKNLHILGTMNTADRSIALLDTALRRRFDFIEILPEPECLTSVKEKSGVDLPKVLKSINDRLEWLLDRDRLIGHGWFIGAESKEDVDLIMRNKIIPLIAEYFHDNWEKLQAVLGGTNDFVIKEKLDPPLNIKDNFDEDRFRWRINPEFSADAYDRLISATSQTKNTD